MSHPIPCARGHGPLRRFLPATFDGSPVEIGGCPRCGGMWIPVGAIRSLFPAGLLTYFSEQGYIDEGPRCPACTQSPPMRQQRVRGVEIDRCLYCLGLWLDGGEMFALGGGADSYATCDVCGIGIPGSETREPTGLGHLCRVCRHAMVLDVDSPNDRRLAPLPEGVEQRQVDGGTVRIAWDVDEEGEETLFEFRGELPECRVRGTLTHENRLTSILRAIGVADIEIGRKDFDACFRVKAELAEPMRRWLGMEGVTDALLRLNREEGATVRVDRGLVTIQGEQEHDLPVPNADVEQACVTVYTALRRVR